MLELLRIRNLALIEDLELEFSTGINVLSGETGAGKSFILSALNFLLGDKLETSMVRDASHSAVVEALFVQDGQEKVIRRELSAETGRSRLYVDDSLSSQTVVRSLRSALVWHTSQHGQQRLLSPAYQAEILDAFIEDKGIVTRKNELLEQLREVLAEKEDLAERMRSLQDKREFLEYQSAEIEKVDPQPGEEEELEARRKTLRDADQLREAIGSALGALHGSEGGGMLDLVNMLRSELDTLASIDPDYAESASDVEAMRQTLMDLDVRLRRSDRESGNAAGAEAIESRLYALAQLKRKLDRSLDQIVELRDEINENISFLDSCALDRKSLERRETALAGDLGAALAALADARRKAADILCASLAEELRGLGFNESVHVQFEFSPVELYPGLSEDRARMLWVPNPGQAPQPLDKIASGGELSRFLLALVGLMTREGLPTLIFDEVDSGIGGLTLTAVGQRIQALAQKQQVILISHWPQLAALATRHFLVQKSVEAGNTNVGCVRLSSDEVFAELSRMAGGGQQGEALARELLSS